MDKKDRKLNLLVKMCRKASQDAFNVFKLNENIGDFIPYAKTIESLKQYKSQEEVFRVGFEKGYHQALMNGWCAEMDHELMEQLKAEEKRINKNKVAKTKGV